MSEASDLVSNARGYVAGRRAYAAKLKAQAEAAYQRIHDAANAASSVAHELDAERRKALEAAEKDPMLPSYPVTEKQIEAIAAPLVAAMREAGEVLSGWQVAMELALAVDECIAGLGYYAADQTWREVPPNTPAAEDVGQVAKTTLYRINPS